MSDTNLVVMCGRLTREPTLRTTPSGVSVCDLGIASNRYSSDKRKFVTFVRVTLWKERAEWAAKKLGVGDTIHLEGQLVDDNFAKDGQKTSGRLKVDNVRSIELLKKRLPTDQQEDDSQLDMEIPEV